MIYPKNPYCPFDKDYMCPGTGNNGNNNGSGTTNPGGGNTGNGNGNMGNGNNGNPGMSGGDDCSCPGTGNGGSNGNTGNMNKNELMQYISELEFAVTDLNLYLDTHPDNAQALEMFTKLAATLKSLKADYARRYAPICATDVKNEIPFEWVSSEHKWPWQA